MNQMLNGMKNIRMKIGWIMISMIRIQSLKIMKPILMVGGKKLLY